MQIRDSTIHDAEAIASLIDAVARERMFLGNTVGFSAEEARAFTSMIRTSNGVQLLAIMSDQIVGWCDIAPVPHEGMRHTGRLGMGVRKDHRGYGIGRKLLDAAIQRTTHSAIERIELEVFASNRTAIRLYEASGFQLEGRKIEGRKLDGVVDDILLYAKRRSA